MTTDELLALYRLRDEDALTHTAALYGDRLHRLAVQILHNEQAAEECVNDTYLKAWNAIPPAHPSHMAAYLSQITRRCAFSMLEKAGAQKRNAAFVAITEEMQECLPDHRLEPPPAEVEFKEWVNAFLATLSVDARRIFLRRYWFADSVHDIAVRYHMTDSKVKTSLHRSRQALLTFLEKEQIAL